MTDTEGPGTFRVTAYRCRCGHEWVPKDIRQTERPRVCPKCKSANWDKVYRFRRGSRRRDTTIGESPEASVE